MATKAQPSLWGLLLVGWGALQMTLGVLRNGALYLTDGVCDYADRRCCGRSAASRF